MPKNPCIYTIKDKNGKIVKLSYDNMRKHILDNYEQYNKELLKYKENAVSIEKSNEVDVRQQTKNGEGVGKGNTESESTTTKSKPNAPNEKAQKIADFIRKGKIDKDILMSGVPFAKEVWNGAVEAMAKTVELTGDIAKAIEDGIEHIKKSDWYNKLSPENKTKAEKRFEQEYSQEKIEAGELPTTGVKKVKTEETRLTLNLPKVELPQMASDVENINAAKERVDSGKSDPQELVNRILENKEGYKNEDEVFDMQYYAHQLEVKNIELTKELAEAKTEEEKAEILSRKQQLSDTIDAQTEAAQVAGNKWHKVGMAMQPVIDIGFNVSREKQFIKEAYGGEMPLDVKQRIDRLTQERDLALAEKAKIEKQLLERSGKVTIEKIKKAVEKRGERVEKIEQLKAQEQDLLAKLRKALKKDSGNLNAGIPIPKETLEVLGELAVNYFKQGIVSLEGIASRMHNLLKDDIENLSKEDIKAFLAEYEPLLKEKEITKLTKKAESLENKTTPTILKTEKGELKGVNGEKQIIDKITSLKKTYQNNTEWVKANQRVTMAEYKIKQEKRKAFESQKNLYQKGLLWAGRLVRISILSGAKVLYKLASAAVIGGGIKRIPEQALGAMYSQLFKSIADKAPIEGYFNTHAEARFWKEFLNPKKFAKNGIEILKTGSSELTKRLGKDDYEHVPILYLPTDLHQIIKDPVKRATFEASFFNGLVWAQKNGLNIDEPLVVLALENAAYKRANYEIFQESNRLSSKFLQWKKEMEAKGNVGATGKFVADFMIPVSTVPTNIVRRLVTTSPLGLIRGGIKVVDAYRKGIEKLSNDEADVIMKQLKQGSLGTALWMVGWFGYSSFGGLYTQFNPDKKRKGYDMKSDEMDVNGTMIEKPVQHALPLEIIQTAATARRIYEMYESKNTPTFENIVNTGLATIGAGLEQIPIIETGVHGVMATQEPYQANKLQEDIKRRFEPTILKETGVIEKTEKKKKHR